MKARNRELLALISNRRASLVDEATSFGSVHTTAERRARWEGHDVPEGLIRLSVGLENADDLVEDVLRALVAPM